MDGVTRNSPSAKTAFLNICDFLESTGFWWNSCDIYLRKWWICAKWKANCLFPWQPPFRANLLSHWLQTNILTQMPAFHPGVLSDASLHPENGCPDFSNVGVSSLAFLPKGHQCSVSTSERDLDHLFKLLPLNQGLWGTCYMNTPT